MCVRIGNGFFCGLKVALCACSRAAEFECDWKVSPTERCNAPICGNHAKEVDKNKHLCPLHQRVFDAWRRRHGVGSMAEYRAKLAGQGVLFPAETQDESQSQRAGTSVRSSP